MNRLPIDDFSDADLHALNLRHTWVTGTKDNRGRVLGRPGSIYDIPDWNVLEADRFFGLSGKSVVEFGSLEGAHTIALAQRAGAVTALEGRDENIEKTRLRLRLYGVTATVLKADIETCTPPKADLFFHSGVLYHLQDPVGHLMRLAPLSGGLLLNTHHAKTAKEEYVAPDRKSHKCWIYKEPPQGYKAGLRPFSRWLLLEDLLGVLGSLYSRVEVLRDTVERNGPRVTIACARG